MSILVVSRKKRFLNGSPFPSGKSPGCRLYLPLWDRNGSTINSSDIISEDVYKYRCAVSGIMRGTQGRVFGGSGFINITSAQIDLASTTKGSIGVWVMLPDATPADNNVLVGFGDTNAIEYILLRIEGTTGKFLVDVAVAGVAKWSLETDAQALADNVFSYVEVVQDGTNPVLRINGVEPAQTFTVSTDKTIWFSGCAGIDNGFIGKASLNNNANYQPLTGTIGEVYIWFRNLSLLESVRQYHGTKWRYQ